MLRRSSKRGDRTCPNNSIVLPLAERGGPIGASHPNNLSANPTIRGWSELFSIAGVGVPHHGEGVIEPFGGGVGAVRNDGDPGGGHIADIAPGVGN